jgi:transposase
MSRKRKNKRPPGPPLASQEELTAILGKAQAALSAEDSAKLKAAIELIGFLRTEIESKTTSIERLKRMIFGPTEKTATVLGKEAASVLTSPHGKPAIAATAPGHGRNAASAYTGATRVKIAHASLCSGAACPGCASGKVYPLAEPATAVRIGGMAPLSACVYERDRLRCNLCGEVYTAPAPAEVGEEKYDESASCMVGMLKYGAGLPFNRIERLQSGMGIPLPAATQWDLVNAAAAKLAPVHEELVRQAAQGDLLHNDDTTMRILKLTREQRAAALGDDADRERTGVFTSGIVAVGAGRKIALFFTGARHAGENLDAVLKRRAAELPAPIQMCDGLSSSETKDFDTLLSNCLAHSRRKYVEVAESFPEEVRFVLETLREVYRWDAEARSQGLNAEERLQLHQEHSASLMQKLSEWMQAQFAERRVEPNSGLGEAIQYMQNHWDALTLFLRIPGAALDNNIMSLIHTAELSGANVFEYLVALQRHAQESAERPALWMPWNYQESLAGSATGPPA